MNRQLLRLLQSLLRRERTRARRRGAVIWVLLLSIAIFVLGRWLHEPMAPKPNPGSTLNCTISRIYDGDTVTARCPQGRLKVRLFGIDAPEMGQRPWGQQSRDTLTRLVPASGIQLQVRDHDVYGRVVAQLYAGDQDLGLTMVRQGQAIVYQRYNDQADYRQAQTQARGEGLGIWSEPGNQQDPALWRRLNPR